MTRSSLAALCLLAFSLPFELEGPLVTLGPVVVTNLEVLLLAALSLGAIPAMRARRGLREPAASQTSRLSWLLLVAFAGACLLSAACAPDFAANAARAALRTSAGIALAWLVARLVTPRDTSALLGALLLGVVIAASLGLAETTGLAIHPLIGAFRRHQAVVGPFPRLSGTFDYPNQAAMYLEAVLPAAVLAAWRLRRSRVVLACVLLAATVILMLALVRTYSRAPLLIVPFTFGGLAAVAHARRSSTTASAALPLGLLALAFPLLVCIQAFVNPVIALRVLGGDEADWYAARVGAPARIRLVSGAAGPIEVNVRNEGAFTWRSNGTTRVLLGARWKREDDATSGEWRWPLPQPVSPGESSTFVIAMQAPERPGSYLLAWDLVQDGVTWFSVKSGRTRSSALEVVASAHDARARAVEPTSDGVPVVLTNGVTIERHGIPKSPRRTELWKVALRMWAERPWTGIGLDNFRLTYGPPLGLQGWDDTVHTNNWYLETLVSVGLLGAIPFFTWLGLLLGDVGIACTRPGAPLWRVSVGCGLMAFGVHGLVDYFLLFHATGLLFWILVGLWFGADEPERACP